MAFRKFYTSSKSSEMCEKLEIGVREKIVFRDKLFSKNWFSSKTFARDVKMKFHRDHSPVRLKIL